MRTPTPEQAKVIHTWGQGMAVQAGAGSGKTTTLVAKCAELLARNPEARFAAVSFTEKSAGDLRAKLSEALADRGGLARHWVMTIHGLCGAIIREHPRESGYEGEETMLSEVESQALWQEALDGILLGALPDGEQAALRRMLAREGRDEVFGLLRRMRDLAGFGALDRLEGPEGDDDALALARLARYAIDRYARLKRRRAGIDFNDLEAGAERALAHADARAQLQRRFDLILVDEFQDTNPVQARILRAITRPDFSNLCIVGDPKQSIYRFRDADVSVFEEFCARMPVQVSLTWNFRSRPGILDFANRVCEPLFEASEMRYESLVPKREPAPVDPVTGEAPAAVLRIDADDPSALVEFVRAEQARGIPLDQMALLLRRVRGPNEKWLRALSAAGIPLAIGSGGFFWEDPRVRELVAFLKWWDQPAQALSGAVFLRAPWVGIDDRLLDTWIQADPTWRAPFLAHDHPISRALAAESARAARPGELLLALLVNDAVEAELGASLLGLWHRVEELSARGYSFHEVVSELDLALKQGRRERDVPPPRNLGQLQVLTLHGSKGLEFPHVILLDFGKKGRRPHAPLLFWDRAKGACLAPRDSSGERDPKSPLEADWRRNEEAKELAESKRVFYVALTRAQERMILVCPRLDEKQEAELAEKDPALLSTDYWRGWIEVAGPELPRAEIPAPAASALPAASPPAVSQPDATSRPEGEASARVVPRARAAATRDTRPRHSVTEWLMLSRCPRSYEWTYLRPPENQSSARAVYGGWGDGSGAGGDGGDGGVTAWLPTRELGTRVHAALEIGDAELARAALAAVEREAGPGRFRAAPVAEWARRSPHMRSSGPERRVWTELAFEVPFEGGAEMGGPAVLVGSIDRVSVESGRVTIVDFKVTEHRKSEQALHDAYQVQLQLYAEALRRLDPALDAEAVFEGILVQISGSEVIETTVQLDRLDILALAEQASVIVAGQTALPRPGNACRACDFLKICDVAVQSFSGTESS